MTANEHPEAARARRFAQHVTDLAAAFGVRLTVDPTLAPEDARAGFLMNARTGRERRDLRCVHVAPVIDESTYAVALHELGHCVDPLGHVSETEGSAKMRATRRSSTFRDLCLLLEEERAAWAWARHYALEWTPLMDRIEAFGIGSYERNVKRIQGYVPGKDEGR